ncbi:MAG: class I SAM-dependent methyltransferase [Nanoarchaeota archaeon]
MNYEEDYHHYLHEHLLKNKRYYSFRARYAAQNYLKYLPSGKILEFGCGMGQNILLQKNRAIGCDISEFSRKVCEERGIKTIKSIEEAPKVDGILSVHVLEHLENPKAILKAFRNKLTPGGRLVIVLPVACKNKPCPQKKMDVSQHLFAWTFGTFNNMLLHEGYKVLHNSFNYSRGFSMFYRLPYHLAVILIKITGVLTNKKEMIFVARI